MRLSAPWKVTALFKYQTAKEGYLKGSGVGFALLLDQLSNTIDSHANSDAFDSRTADDEARILPLGSMQR